MRKITSIILCLFIVISAFGQSIADNDFTAIWEANSGITLQVPEGGGVKPRGYPRFITADFNEDGFMDMISVYYDYDYENVVPLFLGQSDLASITPILVGGELEPFEVGDMGDLDVLKIGSKKYLVAITGGIGGSFTPPDYTDDTKSVLYELDCNDFTFTKIQDLDDIGIRMGAIFFFDWNGDGKEDILILGLNKVYINNGDNTFAAGEEVELPFIATDAITGNEAGQNMFLKAEKIDLNGEGNYGIVASQAGAGGLKLISIKSGTPVVTDIEIPPVAEPQLFAWMSCAVGDLNGDGFMDIVAMNVNRRTDPWKFEIAIFLNDGNGNFTVKEQSPYLMATQGAKIWIYDINGDGINDIYHGGWNARTHSTDPENNNFDTKSYLCINDGTGGFTENYASFNPKQPSIYRGGGCAADLNNDGKIDLIVAEGNITIWPGLINNVPTNIQTVKPAGLNVYSENRTIFVKNISGKVKVFSIDGRCIANVEAASEVAIPISPGLYVVSAGNQVAKVIVK